MISNIRTAEQGSADGNRWRNFAGAKIDHTMNAEHQLTSNRNGVAVEFLRAELRTGLTMARIALHATRYDKTDRTRANARKAYESVLHFIPRIQLEPETADEINLKLEQLRSILHELGEES